MKQFILILVIMVFVISCKSEKKKETTPVKETKVETKTVVEEKSIPNEHYEEVNKIWNSGLSAVTNCVKAKIEKTGQKGIRGYVVIEGVIGVKDNPTKLRIKERTLKIEGLEKCIFAYLKDMVFPTWGYPVKSFGSYSIDIAY
jgi:hypothetical protein